jgi:hypothetical protein
VAAFGGLKKNQNGTKWIIIWLPNHGYQFPTSKSTWKSNFVKIGGFLYFVIQNGCHSKPTMDDCFRNFQNGSRCHGNGQNAKKLKNTKMIIAGYSPNRN